MLRVILLADRGERPDMHTCYNCPCLSLLDWIVLNCLSLSFGSFGAPIFEAKLLAEQSKLKAKDADGWSEPGDDDDDAVDAVAKGVAAEARTILPL